MFVDTRGRAGGAGTAAAAEDAAGEEAGEAADEVLDFFLRFCLPSPLPISRITRLRHVDVVLIVADERDETSPPQARNSEIDVTKVRLCRSEKTDCREVVLGILWSDVCG